MKYKVFLGNTKCKAIYDESNCNIELFMSDYQYIDLADYITIEYTEHSTSGEMTITNSSDRVVHISGWISVDDSDGVTWEETFDEELDSNDSTTIQVHTDGYHVSYWYGHVYAEAEAADDYEWDY